MFITNLECEVMCEGDFSPGSKPSWDWVRNTQNAGEPASIKNFRIFIGSQEITKHISREEFASLQKIYLDECLENYDPRYESEGA